ncbi:MAG TPA: hypothetical protein VHK69_22845 [Chitinophagaceae bacterium]|jgi:hypothetical protein|nr:hypothetical protein [Chitinophagaceae bacterium]
MQQEKNNRQQEELKVLRHLVLHAETATPDEEAELSRLCLQYPYRYMEYMKERDTSDPNKTPLILHKGMIAAFRMCNRSWWLLQYFLVKAPRSAVEKKAFAEAEHILKEMIVRQTKEN